MSLRPARPNHSSGSFCYVVMCHDDAEAVRRLLHRLRALSPTSTVLVRHDQPAGYLDGEEVRRLGAHLLRSATTVRWGEWSMVEAMLEAFRHARDHLAADWVVLVSGHDYPVRDLAAWEDAVRGSGADALLDLDPSPAADRHRYAWWVWSPWQALPLLVRSACRFGWQHGPGRWQRLVLAYPTSRGGRWVTAVRRPGGVSRLGLDYAKGSQWMTLGPAALAVLLDDRATRRARRFFARSRIPDESFCQSLLASSPHVEVRAAPTSWARFDADDPSPRPLRQTDLPSARSSGAAFARKVSSAEADATVRAALETALGTAVADPR